MSLKIGNSLNLSSQNLNQSSAFNNASRTTEDASKNLALAQRLTTDKNLNIQDFGQIVTDVAKLIDSASHFIKKFSNITLAKKFAKISNCLIGFRPTIIPITRPTTNTTSNTTSNTTQAYILTLDRKLFPKLNVQIKEKLSTYIERNIDTILFDKLQSSYSGQFSCNGKANKTFGRSVSTNKARDLASTGIRPYETNNF